MSNKNFLFAIKLVAVLVLGMIPIFQVNKNQIILWGILLLAVALLVFLEYGLERLQEDNFLLPWRPELEGVIGFLLLLNSLAADRIIFIPFILILLIFMWKEKAITKKTSYSGEKDSIPEV